MDVGFLFGWAKEQGIDVPTRSDGSANINELFALYNEWKKKGGESKAESASDSSANDQKIDGQVYAITYYADENKSLALKTMYKK